MTLSIENVIGTIIAAEMYELESLREICKSFILYHAHDVFNGGRIIKLPEKIMAEVSRENNYL